MIMAKVPTACHQIEMLFRCRSRCTPKVLMRPCVTTTAAYMPMVVFGVEKKDVPNVARVEMKVAHAKLHGW